ncbi:hypothetical protein [Xanthobacter autotrophicus]|uniref:hypothetical protein n=1 Tax=Xanthobacter autotrophicus TaxID=280 RepID=UPI0037357204
MHKSALKPGEVLVRVQSAGVNPPDWYLRDGCKMLPLEFRPPELGPHSSGKLRRHIGVGAWRSWGGSPSSCGKMLIFRLFILLIAGCLL